ncbi:MAG: hypothetical protein LUG27_03550, partial [Clostridiales bacterium]|nr:hypothetical protein [Clostridiales bacterium]
MFKQSRRKILVSIMAILICLFLGILVIIYASSYHEVSEENYTMLERYAELYSLEDETSDGNMTDPADVPDSENLSDETLPTESGVPDELSESGNAEIDTESAESNLPADAPDPENTSDEPERPEDTPDTNSPDSRPDDNDLPPEATSTFRLSTFYSVAVSDDGEVLATENTNISYEDDELESIAKYIINSGKGRGIRDNLIYFTMKKDGYTLVAFVDNTIMQESMSTLFRYTLIFGAFAIVLIFFIAIFLARKIVSPLEESYQVQN